MQTQAAIEPHRINAQGRHNLFSIKPYKNNLLTPGANYWIICIHLVILVMALSEAIAWGYLGSLFGSGALGVIAAGVTFVFMFLIIWVIDVSFVTLDLSRSYYDKIILKKETERWVDNTRLGIGMLGRVFIVFVSLSISAPFLAQIVFKQDIDNEIDRRNMAKVSMVSDSMLIAKDEVIAGLDSMIQAQEAALIIETAGKGSSGNYGAGPVTRAMEKNIATLRSERAALMQEKAGMNQTVQSLTVDEFAALHNVDLINNGVRTREEILSGLMENPEYRTAKTAITAFLAFIFAALVLLKLFQPRSVRIYYNEKMQDLYREYLAGHLNKWISVPEQSDNGESQMSPLRFEDWCVNTYSVVRNEDIKRRDSRKIYNLFKMKIEQLEEEKAEIKKMMVPVEAEFDRAMTEVNQMKIELMDVENALQHNDRNNEEIARQLDNITDDLRHNRFLGSDVLIAVTAKKEAEEKLRANKNEGLTLLYKHDFIKHRFDVKDADARQIEALMAKIRMHHRDLQEKIDRERIAYTDLIVSGQVIDIPRPQQGLTPHLPVELDAYQAEEMLTESAAPEIQSEIHEEEINPVENLLSDRTMEETFDSEPAVDLSEGMEDDFYTDKPFTALPQDEEAEMEDNVMMFWDYDDEDSKDEADEQIEERDGPEEEVEFATEAQVNSFEVPEVLAESDKESPITFVDDKQLNAYAEAVSLANYEDDEAAEEEAESDFEETVSLANNEDDEASEEDAEDNFEDGDIHADYFVDPALNGYKSSSRDTYNDAFSNHDPVDVDVSPDNDALEEDAINDDTLEESILQKITGRGNRTDRNGKLIRKGTFGKTLGKGV